MDGRTWSAVSADGTRLGCVTGGAGPPVLLVHGGMCTAQRWAPLWPHLLGDVQVTAMDRRGRGSSPDRAEYSVRAEFEDVAAVADQLASRHGGPVDVVGHSFGALTALGAAARRAALRRLVLVEPPGPSTLPPGWLPRMRAWIDHGELGRVMFSFLVEVIGLEPQEVDALRSTAASGPDPLPIVGRTLVREAEAIQDLDVAELCARVTQPVLLLLGGASSPWAAETTHRLAAQLCDAVVVEMPRLGHEAVDTAAPVVAHHLLTFLRG